MKALKRDTGAADPPHLAIYVSALGRGGAERAMLNLANELVRQNVCVDLIIAKRRESDYLAQLDPAVVLLDLEASPALLGFRKLVRYLRMRKPDAILSVEPGGHVMALGARAVIQGMFTCAASVQNFHSREFDTDISASRRLTLNTMRTTLPRMDRVIAVSGRVAEDVVENFRVPQDRVTVIYNPILTPETEREARQAVARRAARAPDDPPLILTVGRLTRQKNHALLLRAFAQVREAADARLIILGEGEERPTLTQLARELGITDSLSMPGFVADPLSYMANASVFTLSSDWEGLPTVLIEALAVGCQIVSSDCPSGPREILDGGRFGQLVPPGEEEALADAIVSALKEAPNRERLRERARAFSSGRVAEAYARVLFTC